MSLNIIDPFDTPCIYRTPEPPLSIPTSPLTSALEAAEVMAYCGSNGEIANHIERNLESSQEFKNWRSKMPSKTPEILRNYQKFYSKGGVNFDAVNKEILEHGTLLPHNQVLFHGGCWRNVSGTLYSFRPLATTFCPQVAMREAEFAGKAFFKNQIDLVVITLDKPKTKAFIFRHKGTSMGHEKEVLFAKGALITIKKRTLIRTSYPAGRHGSIEKRIESYLVEATLS